jgi:hypothetical protein
MTYFGDIGMYYWRDKKCDSCKLFKGQKDSSRVIRALGKIPFQLSEGVGLNLLAI